MPRSTNERDDRAQRKADLRLMVAPYAATGLSDSAIAHRLNAEGVRKLAGKGAWTNTDVRHLLKDVDVAGLTLALRREIDADGYCNDFRLEKGRRALTRAEWSVVETCPLPPFRTDDIDGKTIIHLTDARELLGTKIPPNWADFQPSQEGLLVPPPALPREEIGQQRGASMAREEHNELLGQLIGRRKHRVDRLRIGGAFSLRAAIQEEFYAEGDPWAVGVIIKEIHKTDLKWRLSPERLAETVADELAITEAIEHLQDKKENKKAFDEYEAKADVLGTHDSTRRGHHFARAKVLGLVEESQLEEGQAVVNVMITAGAIEACVLRGRASIHAKESLQPTPELLRFIERYDARRSAAQATRFPMVVPPKDWTGQESGGYILRDGGRMVHWASPAQLDCLKADHPPMVFEALNALQDTKWRINKGVLDVLNAEGDFAREVPDAEAARRALQIRTAARFKDEPEIHFTYFLDFRGRMYATQHPLNPQADDAAKGLLEFAEGVPLGDGGILQLMIHGANCFGEDKVAEEKRMAWVVEHHEDILASATHPSAPGAFWRTAGDDKYCALAFCFEYAAALRAEDVTLYRSHLPCAYDCSCNAYQHFAAFDQDPDLKEKTWPSTDGEPKDFYSDVARTMQELINAEAQTAPSSQGTGRGAAVAVAARDLCRDIGEKRLRKLVKPGVMTTPYGAVGYSIRPKMKKALQEMGSVAEPFLMRKGGVSYLFEKLTEAIKQEAPSAMVIMARIRAWATESEEGHGACIKKIGKPILAWWSPVGFRVIQDYKDRIEGGAVAESKPVTASVPNVVHSLDAAHMMATISQCLRASEEEIHAFAMVHDSFGTHAARIGQMKKVLWKAFGSQYGIKGERLAMTLGEWDPEVWADRMWAEILSRTPLKSRALAPSEARSA